MDYSDNNVLNCRKVHVFSIIILNVERKRFRGEKSSKKTVTIRECIKVCTQV